MICLLILFAGKTFPVQQFYLEDAIEYTRYRPDLFLTLSLSILFNRLSFQKINPSCLYHTDNRELTSSNKSIAITDDQ